jgi:hypothetical protein
MESRIKYLLEKISALEDTIEELSALSLNARVHVKCKKCGKALINYHEPFWDNGVEYLNIVVTPCTCMPGKNLVDEDGADAHESFGDMDIATMYFMDQEGY